MSRRQRTTLILTVHIPVPLGLSQAGVIEDVHAALQRGLGETRTIPTVNYATNEILVKLVRKETTYI